MTSRDGIGRDRLSDARHAPFDNEFIVEMSGRGREGVNSE